MTSMNMWHEISPPIALVIALSFSTFGCTVTETINDFLSSTTPGDWYTGEGLIKEEYKPHVFVANNLDNLKTDLARGQGEYLTSLTTLLHVPSDRQSQFFSHVQRHYAGMAEERHHMRVTETLIALSRPFKETTRS
ncbi:MAG: DUF3015 family protein [Nitrospirales bacterium]|nr:DUF3015 domain-containing protein [Nitrospirales bacterium]